MSNEIQQHLAIAFRKLLKPLVRILLRHGMGYGDFVEIAKAVYVEVAGTDFSLEKGTKSSDSRVAILTGLTRKDVARQREVLLGEQPILTGKGSRASKVLEGWHKDPDFTGPFEVPMPLPFDGLGSTFSELVRRYSGDMPARAMFEELRRVGAVRKTETGELQVLTRFYVPEKTTPQGISRLGEVLQNLGLNFEHNLNPDRMGVGWFERRIFSERGLSNLEMQRFDGELRSGGPEFLEALDNRLTEGEERSREEREDRKTRVGVQVYLWTDDLDFVFQRNNELRSEINEEEP